MNKNKKNQIKLDKSLITAIREDKIDDVKTLIQKGANVNTFIKNGTTALMLAVQSTNNKFNMSKILIENGADILSLDQQGKNARDHIIEPPEPPREHENSFEACIYC